MTRKHCFKGEISFWYYSLNFIFLIFQKNVNVNFLMNVLLCFFSKFGNIYNIIIWIIITEFNKETLNRPISLINQWIQLTFFLLFFLYYLSANLYIHYYNYEGTKKKIIMQELLMKKQEYFLFFF